MLILHGELDRVQQDRSDEFLKQLNVHHEITNIKSTLDDNKYRLHELKPLYIEEGYMTGNLLQEFINYVVKYAELKARMQD